MDFTAMINTFLQAAISAAVEEQLAGLKAQVEALTKQAETGLGPNGELPEPMKEVMAAHVASLMDDTISRAMEEHEEESHDSEPDENIERAVANVLSRGTFSVEFSRY